MWTFSRVNMSDPATFESLFSSVWNSLDDILLSVGVFLIMRILTRVLKYSLHSYFDTSKFVAQLVEFFTMTIVAVFLLSHLCSPDVVQSLFGGLSIGVGYAFQPYIISFFTGMMIRAEGMMGPRDKVTVQGQDHMIDHIGMFYVHMVDGTYIPNTAFQSSGFRVEKRKCED